MRLRAKRALHRPIVSEAGAVLPMVVLVGLAMTLLCHAVLLLAQTEARASASRVGVVLRRTEARSAAVQAAKDTMSTVDRSTTVGSTSAWTPRRSPGVHARVRRLSHEVWSVEGRALRDGLALEIGLPVWVFDPAGRPGGLPIGPYGITDGPWRLGPLTPRRLGARLDSLGAAVVVPRPVLVRGRCAIQAPTNWGDPTGRVGPCGSHRVAIRIAGDVRVAGGVGQGLVLIEGDADLIGFRHDGVIIATGRVLVGGGSQVRGWVHGERGVTVESGSTVVRSDHTAVAALEHSVLRPPFVIEPVRWLTPPP